MLGEQRFGSGGRQHQTERPNLARWVGPRDRSRTWRWWRWRGGVVLARFCCLLGGLTENPTLAAAERDAGGGKPSGAGTGNNPRPSQRAGRPAAGIPQPRTGPAPGTRGPATVGGGSAGHFLSLPISSRRAKTGSKPLFLRGLVCNRGSGGSPQRNLPRDAGKTHPGGLRGC